MKTIKLEREQVDLLNQIASLDKETIEKVKKYIQRVMHSKQKAKEQNLLAVDDIDYVTDEEIDNAMRPFTHEEKMERLRLAEADPVYYTQEEMRRAAASWKDR